MRSLSKISLRDFTESDLYWLAGLFEGEGTIRLQTRNFHRKNGRTYGPYYYPRASIGMIDRDVIEHVGEILGVGKLYESKSNSSEPEPKKLYTWVVSTTNDVLELARRLRPLMGARRQMQIDKVLNWEGGQ